VNSLITQVIAWPTVLIPLVVFGFAPGAVLRMIVLAFRRDDPRRTELLAELPHVPRIERPFWVCEQLEVALFEGLLGRLAVRTGLRRDGRPAMSRAAASAGIDGQFWDRYRRYLQDVKLMPRQTVSHLDEATDRVLAMLESPGRDGIWRHRGLVVGQVQSGATGNFIGLACKAADAGYKLIVVLAGTSNCLRSQTQLRVEEGFLGFDTQYQQRYGHEASYIGAGALPGTPPLNVICLTTSAQGGDFDPKVASTMNIPLGEYPVALVIKKNARSLENVRKWIVATQAQPASDGRRDVVRGLPALVIDNEADRVPVSVATAGPSRVSAAIRRLLDSFERCSYVGYATTFTNVCMRPDADTDEYGDDIFPRDFIVSLNAPPNYVGPERAFGLHPADRDENASGPLPIVRLVTDYPDWMPDGHKRDWSPPSGLPGSLSEAISAFVLSCAARQARGQVTDHKSMLINVTRFLNVQDRVVGQVYQHLQLLKDRIRHGNQGTPAEEELRSLWDRDFVCTSAAFPANETPSVSWGQVWPEVRSAIEKIEVKVVNGNSGDALRYYEHRQEGLSVIAVGGDELSRGLTLEGLTVTYHLSSSMTPRTLPHMSRWFGYRPGYEDLCRLYLTPAMEAALIEIMAADNKLRRDFEVAATLGSTPAEFGLKFRKSLTDRKEAFRGTSARMGTRRTLLLERHMRALLLTGFLPCSGVTCARARRIPNTLRDQLDACYGLVPTTARTWPWCPAPIGHPQDMKTGGLPDSGVCAAVDVHYLRTGGARAAAVLAADAAFAHPLVERTAEVPLVPSYPAGPVLPARATAAARGSGGCERAGPAGGGRLRRPGPPRPARLGARRPGCLWALT
jgi:hypothetical protein